MSKSADSLWSTAAMTKSQGKPAIAAVNDLFMASPDGLRKIVRAVLQEMLEAEMTDALGAEKGEPGARVGYRSGHCTRTLVTGSASSSCVCRTIDNADCASPSRIVAARGHRGHNAPPDHKMKVYVSGQKRGLTEAIKRDLRRRSAVEPVIGHAKGEHRMGRNFIKRAHGGAANAVLAAAGYNCQAGGLARHHLARHHHGDTRRCARPCPRQGQRS
jgi:hypothetical protein